MVLGAVVAPDELPYVDIGCVFRTTSHFFEVKFADSPVSSSIYDMFYLCTGKVSFLSRIFR